MKKTLLVLLSLSTLAFGYGSGPETGDSHDDHHVEEGHSNSGYSHGPETGDKNDHLEEGHNDHEAHGHGPETGDKHDDHKTEQGH